MQTIPKWPIALAIFLDSIIYDVLMQNISFILKTLNMLEVPIYEPYFPEVPIYEPYFPEVPIYDHLIIIIIHVYIYTTLNHNDTQYNKIILLKWWSATVYKRLKLEIAVA